jgi:hypothetical protein
MGIKIKIFLVFLLFSTSSFSQEVILNCGNQQHYARAIKVYKKKIFVGFSDGELYSIQLNNHAITEIETPTSLSEIRDLDILKDELFVMESSDSSEIWKFNFETEHWSQIRLPHKAVFLDDLLAEKHEIFAFGDAVNDSLVIYSIRPDTCLNEANYLHNVPTGKIALFAASGSAAQKFGYHIGLIYQQNGSIYTQFIPGKHFFRTKRLPLLIKESGGAFSQVLFSFKKNTHIAVVGGDYLKPDRNDSIACYSIDSGNTFQLSNSQPKGYRSHVIQLKGQKLIAVGPTGIDVSEDGGKNWRFVQAGKFHAIKRVGKKVYTTANKGELHVFKWKNWF